MPRASAKKDEAAGASNPLPLPEPVLSHHGETIFKAMGQWKESGRIPPVLLISGPHGVGKREIVHYLSQWLLCERSGLGGSSGTEQEDAGPGLFGELLPAADPTPAADTGPGPCGDCVNCQRALKGNWVDFTEISAETGEGETGSLKIDQFRKLKASLGFSAFDGAFKITLIRDADRMTVQAANSLLKILEEPPAGWIFFLTASDPSLLLPTLVSRCQTLKLKPFTTDALLQLLQDADIPKDRQKVCAEVAQGSWTKALRLADDEIWERRKDVFRFLEDPQAELNHLVDWASQDTAQLYLLLDQLEQVSSELIRWSVDPRNAQIASLDGRKAILTHAATLVKKLGSTEAARDFWFEQAERLFRARQEALAPLNKKLLVQDVLMPWLVA